MKKLILLIVILISSFAYSQNYDFLSSLNKIASDKDAIKIAEEFAYLQPKKLRLLRYQEFPEVSTLLVRFVPEEMTNAQYDKLDKDDQSLFLTVKFNYSNVGENKNLEIKGIKTYKFKEFTGKYLQLFPIWQKYFRQDADANNTTKDSKLQKLIDQSKNINYSFQEDNEGWILINQS